MYLKHEERDCSRFENRIPILFSSCNSEKYHEARIYNSSSSGIYFKSDIPIRPGTEIYVKKKDPTHFSGSDLCRAEVVWCDEIDDDNVFYPFGMGARYCFPDDYWEWILGNKFVRRKYRVIQGGKILGKFKRLKKWEKRA